MLKNFILYIVFSLLNGPLGIGQDTLRFTYGIGLTELTPEHRAQLLPMLDRMSDADSMSVNITGRADYLGNPGINQRISDRRVDHVVEHLLGLSGNLVIKTNSFGEVNSHLEEKLGDKGVLEDRSVTIIFNPVYDKVDPQEYSLDDINKVRVGESIVLKDLNFFPGRHVLVPASIPYLKELLAVLLAHPETHFELQGHICCIAPEPTIKDGWDLDDKNNKLSHNRALNIYNYLVRNGVDSTKLSYKGFGFSQPLFFPEKTKEDRDLNRRVVIKVQKRD